MSNKAKLYYSKSDSKAVIEIDGNSDMFDCVSTKGVPTRTVISKGSWPEMYVEITYNELEIADDGFTELTSIKFK